MTEDILVRLRARTDPWARGAPDADCDDAADEIERLRAAIRWACGEEADANGKWFGDQEFSNSSAGRPRPYAWRGHLRKISSAVPK